MATRQDGNVRKATPNTVTSMRRSAKNRQCPQCGRKSALIRNPELRQTACRWSIEVDKNGQRMCTFSYQWDG